MNQTAGIEKEPIWYGDIESFEKFREKGSACISQLFVGEEDAVPEGTSAAVKKALEFIREHYEAPISLQLSFQTGDEDRFFQLYTGASDRLCKEASFRDEL